MICDNCASNPKNNPYASGFCNCALPAIEQGSGWFQGGRTQTEKTFTTSNFAGTKPYNRNACFASFGGFCYVDSEGE